MEVRDAQGRRLARAAASGQQLRTPALRQDPTIERAYATIAASQARLILQLDAHIEELQAAVEEVWPAPGC